MADPVADSVADPRFGPDSPPRFLADQMLARVARWLRLLGYDCELRSQGSSDEALVNQARGDSRILLTCARSLGELHPDVVMSFPPGDHQLICAQILRRWPLDIEVAGFSRCSLCNVPVEAVAREEILDQLPPKVRHQPWPITRCPNCRRLYWPGGHVERLKQAFRHLKDPE